jgi:hypothetical protein
VDEASVQETSPIGLALDASRANRANAGKPETPAGVYGQIQRHTAVCTNVIVGETDGCAILICMHYAILIGASAEMHMKSVMRLYYRFQPDPEASQTSISERLLEDEYL